VYYHVLLEEMPRLLQALRLAVEDRSFRVLVDTSGGDFVTELLTRLGIERRQILPFHANVRVCAELLLLPAPVPCGHAPPRPLKALRSAILPQDLDALAAGTPLPLMVVLERLGSRRVANHQALVAALRQELGGSYVVVSVQAAGMSVEEQALLFGSAAVLVAPHGSGLSNSIFMPSGSVVLELLPWHYPNLTFYVALTGLPLDHLFYLVRGADAYTSMAVDASDVARRLKAWLQIHRSRYWRLAEPGVAMSTSTEGSVSAPGYTGGAPRKGEL